MWMSSSSNRPTLLFCSTVWCLVALMTTAAVAQQCNSDTSWACQNGECIAAYQLCDGRVHCSDSSDETTEVCISKRCPSYAFRCLYGACVSRKAECDGKRDCADNSDELSSKCEVNSTPVVTSTRCGDDKFQCASGQCIGSERLCDGRRDCADGSDEVVKVCAGTHCPSYGFRCGYGGCVHANAKCNGKADCADGTDENEELCGRPANIPTTEAPLPRCSIKVPTNGQVFYESASTTELFDGSLVEDTISIVYRCRPTYNRLGVDTNFCINSEWTSSPPSCVRYCPRKELLSVSTHATCDYKGISIQCNSTTLLPDTIAHISCAFGYKRVNGRGSDVARCKTDGQWDASILHCEQICGTEAPEGVSYIVGGDYTNNTKVPWHVAIYNDLSSSKHFVQSCGGTILSNRVVLSAAHCFWDKSEGRLFDQSHFMVVTGKYYRDWNAKEPLRTQKIAVQGIRTTPGYRDYEDLYNADLALLELSDAIEFRSYVIPICMEYNLEYNDKYVPPGAEGRVAGWGLTESGGKPSDELKVLDLPVIEVNQCKREVPPEFRSFVTTDKFCAGYTDGQSVCQGDSGGGLVFPKEVDGVKVYFMRGIVSSGPNSHMSCASDKYTVFTNVHFHVSLILDTVRRNND